MRENLTLALIEALQDEYKARATYRAILDRYGPVRPFSNIVESEERHIQALVSLFARYGIPVPEDLWPARVIVPNSIPQACQEGVQAEIENGAMYQRLLAMTTDYPDVQQVFRNLQRASQENHLTAFQRCAMRATPGSTGAVGKEYPITPAEGAGTGGCKKSGQPEGMGETLAMVNRGREHRRRYRRGGPH